MNKLVCHDDEKVSGILHQTFRGAPVTRCLRLRRGAFLAAAIGNDGTVVTEVLDWGGGGQMTRASSRFDDAAGEETPRSAIPAAEAQRETSLGDLFASRVVLNR